MPLTRSKVFVLQVRAHPLSHLIVWYAPPTDRHARNAISVLHRTAAIVPKVDVWHELLSFFAAPFVYRNTQHDVEEKEDTNANHNQITDWQWRVSEFSLRARTDHEEKDEYKEVPCSRRDVRFPRAAASSSSKCETHARTCTQ
jgi:hypothetical protein